MSQRWYPRCTIDRPKSKTFYTCPTSLRRRSMYPLLVLLSGPECTRSSVRIRRVIRTIPEAGTDHEWMRVAMVRSDRLM